MVSSRFHKVEPTYDNTCYDVDDYDTGTEAAGEAGEAAAAGRGCYGT